MHLLLSFLIYGQRVAVYPAAFMRPPELDWDVSPRVYGLDADAKIVLTTKDKITLPCYCFRVTKSSNREDLAKGTVIMFHGNAMDQSGLFEHARKFMDRDFNVLTVEYRGYGDSAGKPSERGLRLDAQAAIEFVFGDERLSKKPVIIFGQSLGGGVATYIASKHADKLHGLILENTMTSIPDVIRDWPVIGRLRFLCTQKWHSAARVPTFPRTFPILMLSSDQDTVIPQTHMQELWRLAQARGLEKDKDVKESKPWPVIGGCFGGRHPQPSEEKPPETKQDDLKDIFQVLRGCGHNNADSHFDYWSAIDRFLSQAFD